MNQKEIDKNLEYYSDFFEAMIWTMNILTIKGKLCANAKIVGQIMTLMMIILARVVAVWRLRNE